jgi:hypothetical protein
MPTNSRRRHLRVSELRLTFRSMETLPSQSRRFKSDSPSGQSVGMSQNGSCVGFSSNYLILWEIYLDTVVDGRFPCAAN